MIKSMTTTVYVCTDGTEFTDLEKAQTHEKNAKRDERHKWLSDCLDEKGYDEGGYNFSTKAAADWIIDNFDVIKNELQGETKRVLYVQADSNDADYVMKESEITPFELKVVRKVCGVIKETGSWPTGEQGSYLERWEGSLAVDEMEIFQRFVPFDDYGIHTIKEVELRDVQILEKIF